MNNNQKSDSFTTGKTLNPAYTFDSFAETGEPIDVKNAEIILRDYNTHE